MRDPGDIVWDTMTLSNSPACGRRQGSTATEQNLGCSRQQVVDLRDSGKLPYSVIGSRRRIARGDVQAFLDKGTVSRREEERSLWLHRALLAPLLRDPERVLARARSNMVKSGSVVYDDDPLRSGVRR